MSFVDTKTAEDIKVFIACEFSDTVRSEFENLGFDAWSCDLRPTEGNTNKHIRGDVRDHLDDGWDLLIVAHPPCTRLCNSGVRWLDVPPKGRTRAEMWTELEEGCDLFSRLWNANIAHRAIENPVMHKHAKGLIENYQPFAQSVQPWQFGHGECKRTCFWLKDLPKLTPTNIVDGREQRIHRMRPGPDRAKERARFYPGIARAMARQWGDYVLRSVNQKAAMAMPHMQADLFADHGVSLY